ncbi:MAG: helix-turn-helix domain-containing protein [Coriobacteriia bacterium]|nr:helix-turn-helix domain-containing protein [Coriobacteriia bacterium]
MKDKYQLTREENTFLAHKKWDESIFSGMRMENRNVTFPQTQTILNGINVAGVELSDILAILNMRDAWKYLLDNLDEKLDIGFLCRIQKRVAYREALSWGELRTGAIGISGVDYLPPIPDAAGAELALLGILAANEAKTQIALDAFAWICMSQLFWDGNKRTALLAANKILIESGAGLLLVPDARMVDFSRLLSGYYETGDQSALADFLYEYCIIGIDYLAPETDTESVGSMITSQKSEPARSAAWLKQARRQKSFTQRSLALTIGVSTSAIANIEQGQRKGSAELWDKIERLLS